MIIEIGIVSLLVIALGFCWRIHKRLMAFRNVQSQIEPSYEKFTGLLGQINKYIEVLKITSDNTSENLQKHIPQGKVLKDDLDILIDHSNRVAKRLDSLIDQAIQAETQLKKTVNITQLRYEEALKTSQSNKVVAQKYESSTPHNQQSEALETTNGNAPKPSEVTQQLNPHTTQNFAPKPPSGILNSQLKNNIQGMR